MKNFASSNTPVDLSKKAAFFRPVLLLLCGLLAWAPVSRAQNIVMQDGFHSKADTIDNLSPTKGKETWKLWSDQGAITIDGTQASIVTDSGKSGAGGHVKASYAFDLAADTLYTLKVTFKFKPTGQDKGGWAGLGFANGEAGNSENEPWLFIDTQNQATDDTFSHGLLGQKEIGNTVLPAADYAAPITAKITWNSSTGEALYSINDQVLTDWTQKVVPAAGRFNVFLEAMSVGDSVKVTDVTLTSETPKK